jgi:pyruvyltransferase
MRAFWYKSSNFGDQLTPWILGHFLGEKIELAGREEKGKLIGVGSILTAIRENDVVWGSGCIREASLSMPLGVKILALRGPESKRMLGISCEEKIEYGDPGLLLPLIYKPDKIKVTHEFGILPHYVDKPIWGKQKLIQSAKLIDIEQPWRFIVDEILSCETIVTSSLHGIIASEAYGRPVIWESYSDKIIGGEFKFRDYFLGTGRYDQRPGRLVEAPQPFVIKAIQENLVKSLKQYYGKN